MIGRRSSRLKLIKKTTGPKGFDDYEIRLGDTMRGERATQGKSLLDVQNELKIKAEYIAAIEDSDPLMFDTPGFIAGYVRSYAKYLGLDPEKSFILFCRESGFKPVNGMDSNSALPNRSKLIKEFDGDKKYLSSRLNATPSSFVPHKENFLNKVDFKALISSLVLVFFLGGLFYGIHNIVQQIQKVEISAIDQPPMLQADLDPLSSFVPVDSASGPILAKKELSYTRIYRPQALDSPILEPRDGPISGIDPKILGTFGAVNSSTSRNITLKDFKPKLFISSTPKPNKKTELQLIKARPYKVQLLASEGVWVRIKDTKGVTLYEQIMNAGSLVDVPSTEIAPFIDRAGNSGSLFFVIDGKLYGPAGEKSSTVKNISLSSKNIINTYDLFTPNVESALYSFLRNLGTIPLND
jgi:cytoskeletal protein RodZ